MDVWGDIAMNKLSTSERQALASALRDALKLSLEARFLHRLHCVQLVARGSKPQEVANTFNDDPSSVARWVRHFKEFGVEGLRDDQKSGRPAGLTPDQSQTLQRQLNQSPVAVGYADNSWSGKLLVLHVEKQYGLNLSVRQCQRLLRRLQDEQCQTAPMPR